MESSDVWSHEREDPTAQRVPRSLAEEGRVHHGAILRQATGMAEAGQLAPRLDPRRFRLGGTRDAYRLLKARHAKGKLVVEIDLPHAHGASIPLPAHLGQSTRLGVHSGSRAFPADD